MSVIRTLTITASALLLSATATAQVTIYEPLPENLDGIVRAQHIKPGDVSPEEYAKLLEEADKVRGFQSTQSSTVYTPQTTTTYSPQITSSQFTQPSEEVRIQLFDAPVTQAATITSPTYDVSRSTSHSVVKGDTLYAISRRYGVALKSLKSANGLSDNNIKLGQLLVIPGTATSRVMETITAPAPTTLVRTVEPIPVGNVYAVLPGDTLYGISRRACVSVSQMASINGIADVSSLTPGQRLTLPSGHCLK